MASLNLDYYKGEDLYSDGEVEEYILDLVKNGDNLKDIINLESNSDRYAVLYHLSILRENIINWYPFEKDCSILEIGGGCGAITGALCQKAKKVTTIELSKRRSMINLYRNEKYDNLEIIVGNINDINIKNKFDYVILNGVFEYSQSFIEGQNPYDKFLTMINGYLDTNGKLLLAIENRLGIKYFSGSAEDHTNEYFLGINNYEKCESVKTFSRIELKHLLKNNNYNKVKFYYPYPDYKFPIEIFTDETINDGKYGRYSYNLEQNKIRLFDEYKVIQSFSEEGVMQCFANSFLVEASMNGEYSNIEYVKLNAGRKDLYKILTIIYHENSKKYVQKKAMNHLAIDHINQLYQNQNRKLNEKFSYLKGKITDDSILYPYLSSDNLALVFKKFIINDNVDMIKSIVHNIYDNFFGDSVWLDDFYNTDFQNVFGFRKSIKKLECVNNVNIDIICDNVYWFDNQFTIIDCEWILDFYVPKQFVIWRTINELYTQIPELNSKLDKEIFYNEFGIDQEMGVLFYEWAVHFAEVYVNEVSLEKFAFQTLPVYLKNYYNEQVIHSALYLDYGDGFSEKNKIEKIFIVETDHSFKVEFAINEKKCIKNIRWDPLEKEYCYCDVKNIYADGVKLDFYSNNSSFDSYFMNIDPQITIACKFDDCPSNIVIEGYFRKLVPEEIYQFYNEMQQSKEKKLNELLNLYETQNSKVSELCNNIKEIESKNQKLNNDIEKLERMNKELNNDIEKLEYINKELNNENLSIIAEKQLLIDKHRFILEFLNKNKLILKKFKKHNNKVDL